MQYIFTKTDDRADNIVARDLITLVHEHPFDALMSAHGPILRIFASRYTMWSLATFDATDLLKEFARWCALQVADLWDAPPNVLSYLETGDESLKVEVGELAFSIAVSNSARSRGAAAASWATKYPYYGGRSDIPARDGAACASIAKAEIEAQKSPGPYVAPLPQANVVKAQRTKFKELIDNAF